MPSIDYAARAAAIAAGQVDKQAAQDLTSAQRRTLNQTAHAALEDGWGDAAVVETPSWSWIHVPASAPLPVVILSERPVTYHGHYLDRTMRPCPGHTTCELCSRGIGRQRRLCLAVFDLRLRAIGILELGETPASTLHQMAEARGHLRGLTILLSREAGRTGGRILCQMPDSNTPPPPDPLPEALPVAEALRATWARAMKSPKGSQ